MKRYVLVILAAVLAAPSAARADDVYADPNDPGRVTRVHHGVSELDLGALGVLTHVSSGDTTSTQISTTISGRYQYFLLDNLSLGAEGIFAYDKEGDATHANSLGGTLFGSFHLRLGLGAFLRPTLALGALFGTRDTDTGVGGVVLEESQSAFLTRLQLPFAYFASQRVVLQAGPELDILAGSFTPSGGGTSTSFTEVVGGFSVAVGYAF